jgi:hypothetical protein
MPDTKWDESDVERVLEWYEQEPSDALIGEEVLRDLSLVELRELFGVRPDNREDPAMYHAYPVEQSHVARIQRAVHHRLELDRFDYFVAAYQRGT